MFGTPPPRLTVLPAPPRWMQQFQDAREMRLAMLRGGSSFDDTVEAVKRAYPLIDPETLDCLEQKGPL